MGTKCCTTTQGPAQTNVPGPLKRTKESQFASTLAKLQAKEGSVYEDLEFRADPSSIAREEDTDSPLHPFRNAEWKKA